MAAARLRFCYARAGNSKALTWLLAHEADANIADKNGDTPLMACAESGSVQMCKALLEKGALLSAQNNDWMTPAHLAAANRRLGVLMLFESFLRKKGGEDGGELRRVEILLSGLLGRLPGEGAEKVQDEIHSLLDTAPMPGACSRDGAK